MTKEELKKKVRELLDSFASDVEPSAGGSSDTDVEKFMSLIQEYEAERNKSVLTAINAANKLAKDYKEEHPDGPFDTESIEAWIKSKLGE